jgi:hypothetical protein
MHNSNIVTPQGKAYTLQVVDEDGRIYQSLTYNMRSARRNLDSALDTASHFVRLGKRCRVSSEGELIWEGTFI